MSTLFLIHSPGQAISVLCELHSYVQKVWENMGDAMVVTGDIVLSYITCWWGRSAEKELPLSSHLPKLLSSKKQQKRPRAYQYHILAMQSHFL